MISHRVINRHVELFRLRLDRLCADWADDIESQKKLLRQRLRADEIVEPLAAQNLEREIALRDRIEQTLAELFERETWRHG